MNVRVQDVVGRRLLLDATSELLVAWVNVRVQDVGERRLHLDAPSAFGFKLSSITEDLAMNQNFLWRATLMLSQ